MFKYGTKILTVNHQGKLVQVRESMGEWNTIIKYLSHRVDIRKEINYECGKGRLYDGYGTVYLVSRSSTISEVKKIVNKIEKINLSV